MRKAFVLLSGGLDSTTALYQAIIDYHPQDLYEPGEIRHRLNPRNDDPLTNVDWVEGISINYKQRHVKEALYAAQTCGALGIKHRVVHIGNLLGKSMLTDSSIEVPDISYGDIKGVSPTYVPNRNMTMLSVLTAQAQLWVNEQVSKEKAEAGVYFGAHAEDAQNWAYPDCTPEFIGAMANAIYIATYQAVRLHTPLQWMMKHEIVSLGDRLGVPFKITWSCYKGDNLHCGICPTCRSRRDAFRIANVEDPTIYANVEAVA